MSEEEHGDFLSSKTTVAIILLIIYTISTPIFHKIHFHYVHESGIIMILGLLIGVIANMFSSTSVTKNLSFNDEVFFNFVLPPIIFSAGYNLKKKSFFTFFFYIVTFGIFGTLVSFGAVSSLTYISNKMNLFSPFNLNLKQILLFSSVIASTDTVAALTFINDDDHPKLFSILFGEGVLNDAVCIVLYRIIKNFSFDNSAFTLWSVLSIINSFMILFIISTLLGVSGGMLCSLILKKLKKFKLNRVQENSLIIFFAFLTYSVSESMGYSPIISLLFCGIFMSHYAFYNLSFQSREESSIVSKIMSNIAEGFVFTYLGLTSGTISHEAFSLSFIVLVFIYCVIGRFLAVYGISFIFNSIRCPGFTFSYNEQGIMFFAGCIRGAIAFGLAISIPEMGDKTIKQLLISSTLVLVFFSTIVFGALMASIVKYFTAEKKVEQKNEQELEKISLSGYEGEFVPVVEQTKREKVEENERKISSRITKWWHKIDDNYLRPFFIDDWPDVKTEHNHIAKEIIGVLEEYQKSRIKKKILNKFDSSNSTKLGSFSSNSTGRMTNGESLLFKE